MGTPKLLMVGIVWFGNCFLESFCRSFCYYNIKFYLSKQAIFIKPQRRQRFLKNQRDLGLLVDKIEQ